MVEEIKTEGKISSIIRNPITADQPVDTVNVARIVFEEMAHDFGTMKEGAVVEHTFDFKNEGKVPLIISNVRSSCGCTAPSWPKDPIEPGKKGKIQVRFNSSGKYEQQVKPVIITANTFPPETKLSIKAFVEKKTIKQIYNDQLGIHFSTGRKFCRHCQLDFYRLDLCGVLLFYDSPAIEKTKRTAPVYE